MSDWGTVGTILAGFATGGITASFSGWLTVRWTFNRQSNAQHHDDLRRTYFTLQSAVKTVQMNVGLLAGTEQSLLRDQGIIRYHAAGEEGVRAVILLQSYREPRADDLSTYLFVFVRLVAEYAARARPEADESMKQDIDTQVDRIMKVTDKEIARIDEEYARSLRWRQGRDRGTAGDAATPDRTSATKKAAA